MARNEENGYVDFKKFQLAVATYCLRWKFFRRLALFSFGAIEREFCDHSQLDAYVHSENTAGFPWSDFKKGIDLPYLKKITYQF